jgi:CDP-archaeol synthase
MQPMLILQFVVLLTLANGTPVIAQKLLGNFLNQPLDGGAAFLDGWPLFGPSKTIRGIVLSILITTGFAPVIGLEWKIGLMAATMAMVGDLLSSFLKHRLKIPPSSRATGLDQIPESLFPALACRSILGLTVLDMTSVVVIFFRWRNGAFPFAFQMECSRSSILGRCSSIARLQIMQRNFWRTIEPYRNDRRTRSD